MNKNIFNSESAAAFHWYISLLTKIGFKYETGSQNEC